MIVVRFQKAFIFQIGFNDSMQRWGQRGATLGALWGIFVVNLCF
jgi:hypothetical protein